MIKHEVSGPVSIENLRLERGGRSVLANFTLHGRAGDCILLTGANGSGKTTLLRYLAGLLPPRREPMPKLHFIGTQKAVKTHLTVFENLQFWQRLWHVPAAQMTGALCDWSLDHLQHVPARLLSSGQRQKLALARLSLDPRSLWLLDEPETALDQPSRDTLCRLIQHHTRAGGMAIVATHQPDLLHTHPNARSVALGNS